MARRIVAAAAALTLASAGCSNDDGEASDAIVPDFLAELVTADLDEWQVDQANAGGNVAFTAGGPDSPLLVGPATFELAGQDTLTVPASTPGGNACRELGFEDRPQPARCVVVGQLDDRGAVEWFAAAPFDVVEPDLLQASVERFDGGDAIIRIGGVLVPVPIRPDATLRCAEAGDLSARPVDVPSRSTLAYLDPSFEVVEVECLYAE